MPKPRNVWAPPPKNKRASRPWKQFLKKKIDKQPAAKLPVQSFGPSWLGLGLTLIPEGGPEAFVQQNQNLFHTGTTSRDEGYFYWALMKILGPEGGQGGWYYQSGHPDPNGAVIDFRVSRFGQSPDLAIRIQSLYFHQQGGAFKMATDREQVFALVGRNFEVVDVWSGRYIFDPTGKAVLSVAQSALAGITSISPVLGD